MAKTLILPIRCSAVKKFYPVIEDVALTVSIVYAVLSDIIWALFLMGYYHFNSSDIAWGLFGITASGIGACYSVLFWLAVLKTCAKRLPTIECIKDEGADRQ